MCLIVQTEDKFKQRFVTNMIFLKKNGLFYKLTEVMYKSKFLKYG